MRLLPRQRPDWSGWPGWTVVAVLMVLFAVAFLGDRGVLQLWRLRTEVEDLHRDVQALEAENERLSRAVVELQHNPEVIERIAREELGLVRPGERVLRFPRTPRSAESPRTPTLAPRAP